MTALPREVSIALEGVRRGSREIRGLTADRKNAVLTALAECMTKERARILSANRVDVQASADAGKPAAFLDRLTLTPERLGGIVASLEAVRELPDPVGEVTESRVLPNGLETKRVRAPLGVLFMIFESRPNVAIEAFSLALKSGNSVILRGGKEACETLRVFYELITRALTSLKLDPAVFFGLENPDRTLLKNLLSEINLIDVVIPRGGDELISFVVQNSRIPIIKNDRGLCHLYLHEDADYEMSARILENGKTQRPGVCNSLETLLVHRKIATQFLPKLHERLQTEGVLWVGCVESRAIVPEIHPLSETSFDTEYLDLKLNVRVVDSFEEAIDHIEKHGSRHSEAIVTSSQKTGECFQRKVDAAAVYWNASTRFTDGFELGLGGEIGISTQKIHVRGPVGLRELTSTRWVITGTGQIRC